MSLAKYMNLNINNNFPPFIKTYKLYSKLEFLAPFPCSNMASLKQAVKQVMAAMIQNHPFNAKLHPPPPSIPNWTSQSVSEVLRSIPRFFFQSPRSIGRQNTFRHRTPLKQRNLRHESVKARRGAHIPGPAAYTDPHKVNLGLNKAMEFFYWVETRFDFTHDEMTCREMAVVLAKGANVKTLWGFLKEMSRREGGGLVTTATITCLIKVLGEVGLANEALASFYRMKQFHCRPDVYAYNTVIYALCRVGNFKKAKFLFEQMELPGFRCPPDTFTYTILISSYCRHALQTGCKKAIRRRIWEANHLFRLMLFKGFNPDVVTYNCLIDGCCKSYRIGRALELFEDMVKRGCCPDRVTYDSFIKYYSSTNEIDKALEMLQRMQKLNHAEPTTSSYTPIIHALCEAGRVTEARDVLVELVERGFIPREHTYKLVDVMLKSSGEISLLDDGLRRKIEDGIRHRYKQVMKVKPIMANKTTL